MPYPDEPVSIVEDLDPEPPPISGRRQWWELALGLALLVGVLVFAGLQGIRQNAQQNSYAAGVAAAGKHNWEAAQTLFASASGYHDADRQAQDAAAKIAQRDNQYRLALANEETGDWAACLKSIQQVIDIQPGYKDSARIEQQASEQVYRDAMSGTIALRSNASPPGLYYYGQGGWTWLPRSDGFSQVQGESPGGWLVYDVPGKDWRPGSPQLAGRRLVVAQLTDLSQAKELTLDPSRYNIFQVGNEGIWALRALGHRESTASGQSPLYLDLRKSVLDASATLYESYATNLTSTMKLPDAIPEPFNHSTVMAFDPNSSRYIISRTQPDNLQTRILVTVFYMGEAGGELRSVFTWQPLGGSVYSAQFSPNGRYLLVTGYIPWESASRFEETQLVDLQGKTPPRMLTPTTVHLTHNVPPALLGDNNWLTSTFLQDGPYKGKVLVAAYNGKEHHLQVIDPEQQGEWVPLLDFKVPSSNAITWTVHPGNEAMSLLSGQEIVPSDYPLVEVPLWFVTLTRDKPPAVTRLRTLINTHLDYARLVGDRLAYSTYGRGQNGRDSRSVFSFPIYRLGEEGENAWTMFTQHDSAGGNDIFTFGDYSFGPTLLAYIADNDLHARLYDGSVDVVLEHHVTYLYNTSLHSDQ
jgi:hypothetical protein